MIISLAKIKRLLSYAEAGNPLTWKSRQTDVLIFNEHDDMIEVISNDMKKKTSADHAQKKSVDISNMRSS